MKLRCKLVLGLAAACLVALPVHILANDADGVGAFTRVVGAKLRSAGSGEFSPATKGQSVSARDTVRTGRRNFAEITFNDQTMLRVNEYTDIVIMQGEFLRKMQLDKGAVWMRVAKGSGTSVQTPVATATVKGTEFSFDSAGNLFVVEGTVWLEAGGDTLEVHAGEGAEVGPDGKPRKKPTPQFPFNPGTQFGNIPAPGDSYTPEPVRPPWFDPNTWHSDSKLEYALLFVPFLVVGNGHPPGHTQDTPEPGTLIVLGAGAFAVVLRRRRKSI